MLENIISFFKKMIGAEQKKATNSKNAANAAKERLHLVLIQDRASVSADFLDAMKQEIIDVIKKYIEIDENAIDVRLTNKTNEDGTSGSPALYANIPITNVKATTVKKEDNENIEENKKEDIKEEKNEKTKVDTVEEIKEETEKAENLVEAGTDEVKSDN